MSRDTRSNETPWKRRGQGQEQTRGTGDGKHAEPDGSNGPIRYGAYLSPYSDIAALMVLEHQTHMTNLITRVGFETRMAEMSSRVINKALGEPEDKLSESSTRRINNASEELLEYMLFSGEAKITDQIRGTSGFAEKFVKGSAPATSRGVRCATGFEQADLPISVQLHDLLRIVR